MISLDMGRQINSETIEDRVHFGRYMWYRKYCLPPPATILDVGCNVYMLTCAALGDVKDHTQFVTDQVGTFTGVDVLDRVIDEMKEQGVTTVKCKVGIETLPFSGNQFNNVFLGEILEHMPREWWKKAIEDCCRVCKNQVLISVPIKYSEFEVGPVHDPEAHTWEPTREEFEEVIRENVGDGVPSFSQLLHVPGEPARNVGFNYCRIIKKEWWV